LLSHLFKDRRLAKPTAQEHRNKAKDAPKHKGKSPKATCYLGLSKLDIEDDSYQRSQQYSQAQATGEQSNGKSGALLRVLSDKYPTSGRFATDCDSLQYPHHEQEQGCYYSYRMIRWQTPDQ
jgi:hypothetical protein